MINVKANLKEEVRSVQNLLFDNLQRKISTGKFPCGEPTGIVAEIAKVSSSKLEMCFGKFGINIKKLVEHFNFNHPCTQAIVSVFSTTVEDQLFEILRLYETAVDFNTPNIIELLNRFVNDLQISKDLDMIMDWQMPIRAIADPKLREEMRRNGRFPKKSGSVYFSEFESDTKKTAWHPNSMRYFVRLNDEPLVDVDHYKQMSARFLELGMEEQANSCIGHIKFSGKNYEKYCGFQKVDLDCLIGTLGKVHGFGMCDGPSSVLSVDANPDLMKFLVFHICPSPNLLRNMLDLIDEDWIVKEPITFLEALKSTGNYSNWKEIVRLFSDTRPFVFYRARVYITSNNIVNKMLSKDMVDIINQLERFHDFGHLPLFDHFLLMVPSISIIDNFYNDKYKGYFINDGKGMRNFEKKEDASVFLDFLMIKHRVVYPIVVGQKDDQQYFIGYCV